MHAGLLSCWFQFPVPVTLGYLGPNYGFRFSRLIYKYIYIYIYILHGGGARHIQGPSMCLSNTGIRAARTRSTTPNNGDPYMWNKKEDRAARWLFKFGVATHCKASLTGLDSATQLDFGLADLQCSGQPMFVTAVCAV